MSDIIPPSAVEAWRRYDDDEQRLSAHVSERMLDLAGLRPGHRVLDVATGRGEPAVRAAARVAPGGLVVGTDAPPTCWTSLGRGLKRRPSPRCSCE